MIRKIVLLSLMCILVNCTTNKMLFAQNNVKLIISTSENTVFDTVKVTAFLKNDSEKDFYFRKPISVNRDIWRLDIFFQDTIKMTYFALIHPKCRISKEDYFLLTSNESYTFTFNVIMSTWIQESLDHNYLKNDAYGEYSIKLSYYDRYRYCKPKKAFRVRVESNSVTVIYKP